MITDDTSAMKPTHGGAPSAPDDMATRAVTGLAGLSGRAGPGQPEGTGASLSDMASALRNRLGADVVALAGGELAGEGGPRRGLIAVTKDTVVFFRHDESGEERIDRPRSAVLWAEVGMVNVLTLRWRDRSPWRLTVDKGDVDRLLRALPSEKGAPVDLRTPAVEPSPPPPPQPPTPQPESAPVPLAPGPAPRPAPASLSMMSPDTCGAIPKVPLSASMPVAPSPSPPRVPAMCPPVKPGPAVLPVAGPSRDGLLAPPVGSFPQSRGPVVPRSPQFPGLGAPNLGWPPATPTEPSFGGHAARRNGFAIASMVVGIVSIIFTVCAPLALVFGYVARRQIRDSGGTQAGRGMALAGIVLGWASIVLFVVMLVFLGALIGSLNNLATGT